MCFLEEQQVQDVSCATGLDTHGYISFTSKLTITIIAFPKLKPQQEASITRNRTKNQAVTKQLSIKRKVGYSEEEVAEAKERFTQMRLD